MRSIQATLLILIVVAHLLLNRTALADDLSDYNLFFINGVALAY